MAVAYIKKLLATALRIALETEVKEIGPQLLEQALTEELWWEGVGKLNPFNTGFEFRRLDRGNEPFESGNFSSARKRRKKAVC
jgi:hypothetical protein